MYPHCGKLHINKRGEMQKEGEVRTRLPIELFRKFKVYCAMNNLSMTQQIEHIVRDFIKISGDKVKIIKIEKDVEK